MESEMTKYTVMVPLIVWGENEEEALCYVNDAIDDVFEALENCDGIIAVGYPDILDVEEYEEP